MDEEELRGVPLEADDEALIVLFQELEKESLDTLDAAGRQVITLTTTLLGLFFGVLALSDAPPYLARWDVQIPGALAILAYFTGLVAALIAVQPFRYTFSRHSLSEMRDTLEEMLSSKSNALRVAHIAFGIGTLSLVLLLLNVLLR